MPMAKRLTLQGMEFNIPLIAEIDIEICKPFLHQNTISAYGRYVTGYAGTRETPEEKPFYELVIIKLGDFPIYDRRLFDCISDYINNPINGYVPQ